MTHGQLLFNYTRNRLTSRDLCKIRLLLLGYTFLLLRKGGGGAMRIPYLDLIISATVNPTNLKNMKFTFEETKPLRVLSFTENHQRWDSD